MADPAGFLKRWSRLKQAEHAKARRHDTVRTAEAPSQEPAPAGEADDPLKDLPPLDSLTGDSDFSVFMRPGVPEELRKAALRKLWTSDPVYANLDGLLEYGEDFAEPFRLAGVVATVYRVLEGMPDPQPPAGEPDAAEDPAAPPTEDAVSPVEPEPDRA